MDAILRPAIRRPRRRPLRAAARRAGRALENLVYAVPLIVATLSIVSYYVDPKGTHTVALLLAIWHVGSAIVQSLAPALLHP